MPSAPTAPDNHTRKTIPIPRKISAVTVSTAAFFINFPVCTLTTHLLEKIIINRCQAVKGFYVGFTRLGQSRRSLELGYGGGGLAAICAVNRYFSYVLKAGADGVKHNL